MSETADSVAASLKIQQETSKKIVEMTSQMATMTDLAREANRAYERMSDILLIISSMSSTTIQVDEISMGIQRLETTAQSMHKYKAELLSNVEIDRSLQMKKNGRF
jgi:hypothetical protein